MISLVAVVVIHSFGQTKTYVIMCSSFTIPCITNYSGAWLSSLPPIQTLTPVYETPVHSQNGWCFTLFLVASLILTDLFNVLVSR